MKVRHILLLNKLGTSGRSPVPLDPLDGFEGLNLLVQGQGIMAGWAETKALLSAIGASGSGG